MYTNKYYLIFLLFLFEYSILSGQMNVKVGYNLGYLDMPVNNIILQKYNESNPGLEERFKDIHIIQGIVVGARVKSSSFGVDLSWQNLSKSIEAIGFNANDDVFTKKLYYSFNTLSLGLENYLGRFGYGGSIDKRTLRIKTDIPTTDSKRGLIKQSEYASKFYLLFEIQKSKKVSLVLRASIQVPWGEYNLNTLAKELIPGEPSSGFTDKSYIYGLSIIFYNGRQ